jgi:hypothetical protein
MAVTISSSPERAVRLAPLSGALKRNGLKTSLDSEMTARVPDNGIARRHNSLLWSCL